jgi:flagellar protein FlgJ
MTLSSVSQTGRVGVTSTPDERRLADVVRQLEGVFVEQLFKAMRETVPTDGLVSGGAGEEMFNGLMDQHLAAEVPTQWPSTLSDALIERFRAANALPMPEAQ